MAETLDQDLIREYARKGAEASFRELVHRHVDLVYSTAFRVLRNAELAEEVSQRVFVALARNAEKLEQRAVLAGWLHQTARNFALETVRSEERRRQREREAVAIRNSDSDDTQSAWDQIAPHLDAALAQLDEDDRDTILLRYFERKTAKEIGERLGLTAEAAQKRAARALERLRIILAERGVAAPTTALATVLSLQAIQSAPVGLTASVIAAGAAETITSATATIGLIMASTKIKIGLAAALIAAASIPLAIQHRTNTRLRGEVQTLHQQHTVVLQENDRLKRGRENAASRLVALAEQMAKTKAVPAELLRLRGEVTRLSSELRESPMARIVSLKHKLEEMPDKRIPELQFLTEKEWAVVAWDADLNSNDGARRAFGALRERAIDRFLTEGMMPAVQKCLAANGGVLPPDLFQLKPYFDKSVTDEMLQRYQLLQAGKPDAGGLVRLSALVDDEYDAQFTMSLKGIQGGDYNLARETVKIAAGEFAKANNGERPSDASQLATYLKHPLDAAIVQKYFQRYLEDVARPPVETTIRKATEDTSGNAP